MLASKLESLKDSFLCPQCRTEALSLSSGQSELLCSRCQVNYPIINGCPILLTEQGRAELELELQTETGRAMQEEYSQAGKNGNTSWLAKGISWLKPPAVLYDYNPDLSQSHTQRIFNHKGDRTTVLNVGGGPTRYSDKEITLNLRPFYNVDSVGDAHNIPYLDNSFDSVICNAVLEHVHNPERVVEEMMRVLKPGGILYAEVPFIFFFHGYPNDFKRYTLEGMKRLFGNLRAPQFGMTQGPVSACLQSINALIDIVVPDNLIVLRKLCNGAFRWAFFWFKYFDKLMVNKVEAHRLAAGFYVIGEK